MDHAIEFDKPRVRMHYSTLQASNGWQCCRSSHIHNCNHANILNAYTPYCQLSGVTLHVWSITESGNWVGSVALDMLCDRAYSFGHQDCFLSTCNWTSPKSDWAAPVTLTIKSRKVFKTWWGEWIIGWHELEQDIIWNTSFTALLRDCWQLSATLPVI